MSKTRIPLIFVLVVNHVMSTLQQNETDINSTRSSPIIPQLLNSLIAQLPQSEQNAVQKYLDEQNQMAGDFKKLACILPAYDFSCAMNTMNMEVTDVYNSKGITFVQCGSCKWPERIYNLRKDNDLCEEVPSLMYGESDNIGIKKWYSFVSQNPKQLYFNVSYDKVRIRNSLIATYKKFALNLGDELKKYYNGMKVPLRQARYPKGKTDFFSHFAAIIQRSYRLGNYYTRVLQFQIRKQMRRRYANGTKMYLTNALKVSLPTWYFDDEHIDMLNILRKAEGYGDKEDLFYIAVNLTNVLEQPVVIPGLRNCGKQPMPVEFYRQCYL